MFGIGKKKGEETSPTVKALEGLMFTIMLTGNEQISRENMDSLERNKNKFSRYIDLVISGDTSVAVYPQSKSAVSLWNEMMKRGGKFEHVIDYEKNKEEIDALRKEWKEINKIEKDIIKRGRKIVNSMSDEEFDELLKTSYEKNGYPEGMNAETVANESPIAEEIKEESSSEETASTTEETVNSDDTTETMDEKVTEKKSFLSKLFDSRFFKRIIEFLNKLFKQTVDAASEKAAKEFDPDSFFDNDTCDTMSDEACDAAESESPTEEDDPVESANGTDDGNGNDDVKDDEDVASVTQDDDMEFDANTGFINNPVKFDIDSQKVVPIVFNNDNLKAATFDQFGNLIVDPVERGYEEYLKAYPELETLWNLAASANYRIIFSPYVDAKRTPTPIDGVIAADIIDVNDIFIRRLIVDVATIHGNYITLMTPNFSALLIDEISVNIADTDTVLSMLTREFAPEEIARLQSNMPKRYRDVLTHVDMSGLRGKKLSISQHSRLIDNLAKVLFYSNLGDIAEGRFRFEDYKSIDNFKLICDGVVGFIPDVNIPVPSNHMNLAIPKTWIAFNGKKKSKVSYGQLSDQEGINTAG